MSLFTLHDVWSYDCHESNPHTFCHKSVVIGNVDNEEAIDGGGGSTGATSLEKVVLANYSGLLRVIASGGSNAQAEADGDPHGRQDKGTLLAELHLGAPILQIEAGYFLGIADQLDIAILHPHRLGIYTITKLSGQIEHGSQYKVTLLYEHPLKRHAFNMCYGRFGSPSAYGGAGASSSSSTSALTPTPVVVGSGGGGVASRRGRKTNKSGIAGMAEDALEETKRAMRHASQTSMPMSGHTLTAKRKDFICVQSLDGTLSFFEQEVYTFSCYLPNFLLPGPLAYVQESDCFLTTGSDWELQCFKYAHLLAIGTSAGTGAAGQENGTTKQIQESSLGKRLVADWSYSLGEETICDIQVLATKGPPKGREREQGQGQGRSRTRLVLATFRHLYCFDVSGDLLWCKRLDFQMSSFVSYLNTSNEVITLATSIGSPAPEATDSSTGVEPDLGTLYVFSGTGLKWAAKLPFAVVFIGRIPIGHVPGGIALLSSRGQLAVQCLGTEPSLFVAPTVESRELDYEAAEQELTQLRKTINAHAAASEEDIVTPKDNTVEVKMEFEGQNTRWLEPEDGQGRGQEIVALVATIKLVARVRVSDVRVTVSMPPPIVCTLESVHVGDIVGRHNYTVEFHTGSDAIPVDLACTLAVFYTSDAGVPYLVHKTGIRIPLFIVAKPSPIVDKSGNAKLTFGVNKPVLNLTSFYNDFDWSTEAAATTNSSPGTNVCFQLCGGEKVAVLVSTKSSTAPGADAVSRYRIQSNAIAAIHLVFHDFVERLSRKFGRQVGSDLEISIMNPSPGEQPLLGEYFHEIEEHVVRRRRELQIRADISDRASQLRAVQRRLLVRFRDKAISPGVAAPLTQLETLLDGSLEQLLDALYLQEQNEAEKQKTECKLAGGTRLMLELAQLAGKRKIDDVSLVQVTAALCPGALPDFVQEAGWEEAAFTGLSYLKTNQVVSCTGLAQLDTAKLQKVIRTTLEKIRQPSTTTANQNNTAAPPAHASSHEVLAGNEIVERMASARGRTARRRLGTAATAVGVRSLDSIPEPDHDQEHPEAVVPDSEVEIEPVKDSVSGGASGGGRLKKKSLTAMKPEPELEPESNHPPNKNHNYNNAIAHNNNNVDDDDNFW